jgi:hypothetical protein
VKRKEYYLEFKGNTVWISVTHTATDVKC